MEYGLGIALVCVVSLGAISWLTDSSSDEFEDRTDTVGLARPRGRERPGGHHRRRRRQLPPPATAGIPGPPHLPPSRPDPATGAGSRRDNSWDATVTLSMEGDGDPVEGLQITGQLDHLHRRASPKPPETPVSCTTDSTGECVFTRDEMEWRRPHSPTVTKAVFHVTGYTYTVSDPSQTYTIPPAPAQTIEVTRPPT